MEYGMADGRDVGGFLHENSGFFRSIFADLLNNLIVFWEKRVGILFCGRA